MPSLLKVRPVQAFSVFEKASVRDTAAVDLVAPSTDHKCMNMPKSDLDNLLLKLTLTLNLTLTLILNPNRKN